MPEGKDRIKTPSQWARTQADFPSESGAKFFKKEGTTYAEMRIPPQFQSRGVIVDAFKEGNERTPIPPFRVEYVLLNPFSVFDDTARSEGRFTEHIGLTVADDNADKCVEYFYDVNGTANQKKAKLTWKTLNREVTRLVLEVDEPDAITALSVSDAVVSRVLDYISFATELPLAIHHIEVFEATTNELVKLYMVFPHLQKVELTWQLLTGHVPPPLIPLLRLFREAVNSINPYYRLLCLFRIGEGLRKTIRTLNNQKVKELESARKRPKQKIPENEFTQRAFPHWIGKPMESFLDHVEHNFRKYIAHLIIDESLNWAPDPGTARHANDTDKVNCMLISIIRQLLVDEWTFMRENGIDDSNSEVNAAS